jgi:hypothetical protein
VASFMAHNRQCTLVLTVVVLILLVGLLSSPNPALAQSAVTVDPPEGAPGTEVTATGSGWSAGHGVSVQWDNGTELTTTTVDDNGGFTVSFTVPDGAAEGQHTVYFVDAPPEGGSGYFIPATFTVTASSEPPPPEAQPTITVDPAEGTPGTEVTVTGSGWIPGDTIFIHFAVAGNQIAQATVADDGSFVASFTIPSDAEIGEQLVIAGNLDVSWQTDAPFHVTEPEEPSCPEPTVTLSAGGGDVGAEITVQGQGWLPGGTVALTITSGPDRYDVGSVQVPESGAWESSFTVPDVLGGEYELVVSETHEGCELLITEFFWVEPSSSITLDPTEGPPGTEVTVWGSGWLPFEPVELTFVINPDTEDTSWHGLGMITVADDGTFQTTFTVPADTAVGEHRVEAFTAGADWWKAAVFRVTDGGGEPDLIANAGPDQTVPGPSPVTVQLDGSGSTGDIVSYKWYNQYGLLRAEGVAPVIDVNFGYDDPQPGTARTFTLVVADSQGNTAQDEVTITLGETEEEKEPFNPQVRALQFYETGPEDLPPDQRVYQQRFASETSRYINWVLDLEHPAPGRRVDFKITAIYLRDNGAGSWEELWRGTTDTYVEGDWTWSSHWSGLGCDDPSNCWEIGLYRVDIYFEGLNVDGQLIASEQFEIYGACPEATVTISPSTVKIGDTITVQGKGWNPGGTVAIFADGPTQFDVGSVSVPDSGEWKTNFTVPDDALPGDYQLAFREDHEGCKITVVVPAFTVQEGQPPAAPSNLKAEPVTQQGKPGTQLSWTDTADNEEGFRVVDQNRPQEYEAEAASGTGSTVSIILPFTSGCFRVYAYNKFGRSPLSEMVCIETSEGKPPCPNPTITLSTSSGSRGDTFRVQGKGWLPGGTVVVTLSGSPGGSPGRYDLGSVPVPDSGAWESSFTVPRYSSPVAHDMAFREDHEGCKLRVTKRFTITLTSDELKEAALHDAQRNAVELVLGPVGCFLFDAAEGLLRWSPNFGQIAKIGSCS